MKSIDELSSDLSFTTAKAGAERTVTFLPEPPRAQRRYTVISVDDHIVEPRIPSSDECRANWPTGRRGSSRPKPRPDLDVRRPIAAQRRVQRGGRASGVGVRLRAARFDEMRRGAWDIHARIKDMDINGVYASLNFPSFLPGFAGQRLQLTTGDRELALASVRAWNDWHHEVWAAPTPTASSDVSCPGCWIPRSERP